MGHAELSKPYRILSSRALDVPLRTSRSRLMTTRGGQDNAEVIRAAIQIWIDGNLR
jgi:hypothetical protein